MKLHDRMDSVDDDDADDDDDDDAFFIEQLVVGAASRRPSSAVSNVSCVSTELSAFLPPTTSLVPAAVCLTCPLR